MSEGCAWEPQAAVSGAPPSGQRRIGFLSFFR